MPTLCFWEMKFSFQFQNLFHFKTKRIAFLMGLIVIIHLSFQPLVLHSGNTLHSLLSNDKEDIDPKLIEAERVLTDGVKSETRDKIALTLQDNKSKSHNESMAIEKFVRRMRERTFTFSEMNSILIKSPASSGSLRRRLSARERELLAAKKRIKIAHAHSSNTKINPELHPSLFRNVSMFQRSYELMERGTHAEILYIQGR